MYSPFEENAVESGGGAEVHDYAGATVLFERGHGIDDAIRAHFGRICHNARACRF